MKFRKSISLVFTVSSLKTSYSYIGSSIRLKFSRMTSSSSYYYTDFDCNLSHEHLKLDRHRLLSEALLKNIKVFICPGIDLNDSESNLLSFPDIPDTARILLTCGVHPYHSEKDHLCEENINRLERLLEHPSCLAVGECGLDYSEGFPANELQLPWLKLQIDLAIKYKKPLYLHIRRAEEDFFSLFSSFGYSAENHFPYKCVVHCFTGNEETLQKYLDWGFYIGLTGYIFSLPAETLNRQLQMITLDRLVIETDAPYMGFKGCRKTEPKKKNQRYPNVPSSLVMTAELIAKTAGWTEEQVARSCSRNSLSFFGLEE